MAKTRNVPMITSAFHAKGMVPNPVTKGNEFTVPDFIEKIIKYSELISDIRDFCRQQHFFTSQKGFQEITTTYLANQKIATIDQAMQATWIMPHYRIQCTYTIFY
jgi:hypothetical protein